MSLLIYLQSNIKKRVSLSRLLSESLIKALQRCTMQPASIETNCCDRREV